MPAQKNSQLLLSSKTFTAGWPRTIQILSNGYPRLSRVTVMFKTCIRSYSTTSALKRTGNYSTSLISNSQTVFNRTKTMNSKWIAWQERTLTAMKLTLTFLGVMKTVHTRGSSSYSDHVYLKNSRTKTKVNRALSTIVNPNSSRDLAHKLKKSQEYLGNPDLVLIMNNQRLKLD